MTISFVDMLLKIGMSSLPWQLKISLKDQRNLKHTNLNFTVF